MFKDSNFCCDVDCEFFLFFVIFDENRSWYFNENINKYCLNFGFFN